MAHKKPTDLIELAQDWERKLAKCEAQKADLLAALRAAAAALFTIANDDWGDIDVRGTFATSGLRRHLETTCGLACEWGREARAAIERNS
jgi:hypothetical protein